MRIYGTLVPAECQIDLLFIDGDHSYKGVKNDVKKFTPFVKQSGYTIFHDAVGIRSELQPIINSLLKNKWTKVDGVDYAGLFVDNIDYNRKYDFISSI